MTFKETEIGLIPEDWDLDKLKNHLITKGRIGWKGLKKSEYLNEGFAIINGEQIVNDKIDWENAGRITKERYDESPEIILKEKDILMTKDGTIGKLAYIKQLLEPTTVASGIFVIRNNSSKLDQIYLFYYFKSKYFADLVNSRIEGSVVPHLYQRDIIELNVPLPPLTEQQKISSILSSLDDKIELNNQINQTLEKIAQAIFKNWFIDFEFPNNEGKPYKSSGGEMIDSELEEIPKGWSVVKLSEITSNFDSKRIPLSSIERTNRKGIYPYYGAASIVDYVNDYIFDGTYLLLGEDGTVIDENEHPILQYVWGKFWVNNHAHVMQGKDFISTEFLYLLLKNLNVKELITGAVQSKISQGNLNSIKVIKPDSDVFEIFKNLVKNIFDFRKKNIEENRLLSRLRDSLLPKLMSGKIRVRL